MLGSFVTPVDGIRTLFVEVGTEAGFQLVATFQFMLVAPVQVTVLPTLKFTVLLAAPAVGVCIVVTPEVVLG